MSDRKGKSKSGLKNSLFSPNPALVVLVDGMDTMTGSDSC